MKKCIRAKGLLVGAIGVAAFSVVTFVSDTASAVGLRCTVSSGTSLTGREWAEVDISPQDPTICLRRRLGGDAPQGYPSCHNRARNELGCVTVIDVN